MSSLNTNHLKINNTLKLPVLTTTERDALTPESGMMIFNTTTNQAELYFKSSWVPAGESLAPVPVGAEEDEYPSPVTSGLVLHLDANKPDGFTGTTWIDFSNTMGNVNINNRNSDWSFQTESSTGLKAVYNVTNRTSSAGMNVPVNNGFNKITGTVELWIRPGGDYTGGHGFFNNSDGSSYTNAGNWLWFGTWSNSDCVYFRQGNPSTCCNDVASCSYKSSGYYNLNEWQQLVVTWNVAGSTATIYKNTTPIYSRSDLPTNIPNNNPTNTGQIFNGHVRGDNQQFKGYCSQYRIYNRALSQQEIIQNFNTFKSFHNLT